MNVAKIKNYLLLLDPHDEKNLRRAVIGGFVFLAVLALLIRQPLINFNTGDYQAFGGWYDFVKAHGLHSFKYEFSNYNPPYTYFLYILTLLPIAKMTAIKGLLIVFDILLALSVYCVVKVFKPKGYLPWIAALVTMYVPTVVVTGVFWGQFDQLYVALVLFSLWAALRNNSKWAWILFALAFSVKFQAIFFLPIFGLLIFKRIRLLDMLWGVGAFLLVTLPPMVVGRSLGSLLMIYPHQATSPLFVGYLTIDAPNLYQWFPNQVYDYIDHFAIGLAAAFAVFVVLIGLWYRKFSNREILIGSTLLLYAMPYLLPAMHERYIFPAGIASVVVAFAYPTVLNAVVAVAMQLITLFAYCPYLFNTEPISMKVLPIFVLGIMGILMGQYLKPEPKDQKQLK